MEFITTTATNLEGLFFLNEPDQFMVESLLAHYEKAGLQTMLSQIFLNYYHLFNKPF